MKSAAERLIVGVLACIGLTGIAPAQTAPAPEEAMSAFAWYEALPAPGGGAAKYVDFLVTPEVFGKARGDLADLRLRDSLNREIQYALRVRAAENRFEERKAESFNHVRQPADRSDEISLDLGDQPVEHNEVVIETNSTDFRRPVRLEGSDRRDGDWKVLVDQATLLRFQVGSQMLSNNRVHYPVSRFRYLRVRVYPDPGLKNDSPTILSVSVFQSTRVPGVDLTLAANLGGREFVPTDSGPGTQWIIDLGHDAVPCSRLRFQVADDDFVRDYQLELVPDEADPSRLRGPAPGPMMKDGRYAPYDNYQNYQSYGGVVASGQWRRRAGTAHVPMEIAFSEVRTHRLRLKITDHRNPPLTLQSVEFSAAAREVIFDRSTAEGPMWLFFGNPRATDPNYDFGRNLPVALVPPPERLQFSGNVEPNPDFRPEPKPWTERWPWLIYLVLGAASLTLLGILGLLGREVVQRHDARATPASAP